MNRRSFLTALAAAVVAPEEIAEAVAHEPHPPPLAELVPAGSRDAYDAALVVHRRGPNDTRTLRAAYESSAQAIAEFVAEDTRLIEKMHARLPPRPVPKGRQFTFPLHP